MYYNRNNPQWKFSQDQDLSADDKGRLIDEYKEFCKGMLKVDVRDWNTKLYGQDDGGRKVSTSGIVISIIIFASIVLLLIFKQLLIFGYAACGLFLFAGLSMIVTGKGEKVESSSRAYLNRTIGSCIALASLAIILLIVFRGKFGNAEFFILLFVISFGFGGAGILIVSILRAVSGKTVYTLETGAQCTGYVRYVSGDSGNNTGTTYFIYSSPLFSYSVDGERYEAVWDEFVSKTDPGIALGETVSIKVDPRHPENILSPSTTHPGAAVFMIFMGIAFLAVAAGLGFYVASGAAEGMTVETSWNPLVEKINGSEETGLYQIKDEDVEKLLAKKNTDTQKWYCETASVATVEKDPNGQSLTFSSDEFNGALYQNKDKTVEAGKDLIVFYTVNEEQLEYGKGFKHIFTIADPDEYEYKGTHSAFKTGD